MNEISLAANSMDTIKLPYQYHTQLGRGTSPYGVSERGRNANTPGGGNKS